VILKVVNLKINYIKYYKYMQKYNLKLCNYLYFRNLEGINLNTKYQNMRVEKRYIEVFKSVRVLK
jgi:hypothetical protein